VLSFRRGIMKGNDEWVGEKLLGISIPLPSPARRSHPFSWIHLHSSGCIDVWDVKQWVSGEYAPRRLEIYVPYVYVLSLDYEWDWR
jgi:hypothetical protein